jgi:MOSC domain-containing protein YiiM
MSTMTTPPLPGGEAAEPAARFPGLAVSIAHLFISPGHNYFGHYGGPAGQHPALSVPEIECVAGRGIRGDRFFDYRPDYKGQITFFAEEDLLKMWDDLKLPAGSRDPSACRRNVITCGFEPAAWIGKEFHLQGVRFLGVEECRPCDWMNSAIHERAEGWLRGRGGLRARILAGGKLKVTSRLVGL